MKDGKYVTLGQLEADVELMCRNTQEYNIEGSQIYEDSVTLWSVFSSAKTRLLEHEAQMAKEARERHQTAAKEAADNNNDDDEDTKNNDDDNDLGGENDESDDDG